MIKCNLFKFLFVYNFHNKKKIVVVSLISFGTIKYACVIKTREMFSFPPLINNSVTIDLSFSLLSIPSMVSSETINILGFLFGLYS